MGDRTHVTVELRKADYNDLKTSHPKDFGEAFEYGEVHEDSELTITFYAEECNYGEWGEVTGFLREHEVEFNRCWGQGSDYGSGYEYVRHIDGEYISTEGYDDYDTYYKALQEMKEIIEEGDMNKLKDYILIKHKQEFPYVIKDLNDPNSVRFMKDK